MDALSRVIASNQYSLVMRWHLLRASLRHLLVLNTQSWLILVHQLTLMTAALTYTNNKAIKLSSGNEIIVPVVSWPTTYYPLNQYGLHLKFVDIDLKTLNYNLSSLEDAVTDNTRAIMVVNLLGNPNNFDEIKRIIGDRNIVLVEDTVSPWEPHLTVNKAEHLV